MCKCQGVSRCVKVGHVWKSVWACSNTRCVRASMLDVDIHMPARRLGKVRRVLLMHTTARGCAVVCATRQSQP